MNKDQLIEFHENADVKVKLLITVNGVEIERDLPHEIRWNPELTKLTNEVVEQEYFDQLSDIADRYNEAQR